MKLLWSSISSIGFDGLNGYSTIVLPAGLLAKAIQLCAAGLGAAASPGPAAYAVSVRTGATLSRQPESQADAEATVRDLLTLGVDFDAGPLEINGRDFATYAVTPTSVFDACTLAHIDDRPQLAGVGEAPTISSVAGLLRRMFSARITDTIRPMDATYGARNSWHKVGQAIDFVPSAGVMAINRDEIRAAMAANGIRLLELLGPGDRGHANHWHVAFARAGQVIDRTVPIEGEEDWIVAAANVGGPSAAAILGAGPPPARASVPLSGEKAPPLWDVFASQEWRATHGSAS